MLTRIAYLVHKWDSYFSLSAIHPGLQEMICLLLSKLDEHDTGLVYDRCRPGQSLLDRNAYTNS